MTFFIFFTSPLRRRQDRNKFCSQALNNWLSPIKGVETVREMLNQGFSHNALEFIRNTEREGDKSLEVQTFSTPIFLPPSFSHKFVSFVSSCMYLYLLPAVQSLYQESASLIEEEYLQQLDSKLSCYNMVFITGKLFSASTSHAFA